ncbi:MAG: Protein-L-isoaspartate O-methyltransferase [Candidatus Diapherotrites archaeon ADurb.Bin253]|jgi:protein-L-isoaspartate(D-aspartate) O-methyltransferase|nr:MAG: Protein-L-isoaspartate O-methyltransferase [Candidatus Diapherotrites archaeon ADurb.Bin253]HNZ52031.1 protein-L-isoaspartate O-methyltransferase [Candidatus Pacearchaeota archaeon]HOC96774.1 protein-L-isoaspartate O-methyltransferase [Candidatus Pacearchaeota archaeon]HOH04113.1 protein-L-isoaspartate O-methyltransferase [Candidatus Pacearchaeota archaeon]HOR52480.1 protein-L-isoaspartate O-methyltransferase [Candidatus Pacearchaeota archaeon]
MDREGLIKSLRAKGFKDNIIQAFCNVKREDFVSEGFQRLAYEDIALPLTNDQTISQPSTIALVLSLLKLRENQKVLEIGSGCGYTLALITEIIGEQGKAYGAEIVKELADLSVEKLKKYSNVKIYNKNGKEKFEEAPFNRILISAALKEIPHEILDQLADNGIIVAPLGSGFLQTLTAIRKISGKYIIEKEIPGFMFVKFID